MIYTRKQSRNAVSSRTANYTSPREQTRAGTEENIQPHSLTKYSYWLAFLYCLVISLLTMASTLWHPFFTIDDSDLINRAQRYLDELGYAAYFRSFIPHELIQRRYWPGFLNYTMLRIQLFGLNSILWHLWQIAIFCSIGLSLCVVSLKLFRTNVPAVVTLLIILSAGDFTYQTNWFAYVFTNSFEPIISMLWSCSVVLYLLASSLRGKSFVLLSLIATLFVILTITIKENVFLVTGASAGLCLGLSWATTLKFRRFRWHMTAILLISAVWGGWVYSIIPKDQAYAGVSTLNSTPAQVWETLKKYVTYISDSTGLLIPVGITLGAIRIAIERKNALPYLLCVSFAMFHVLSVVIWPETSLRLIFPSFTLLVFLTCCEVYVLFKRLVQIEFSSSVTWLFGAMVGSAVVSLVLLCVFSRSENNAFLWFLFAASVLPAILYVLPKSDTVLKLAASGFSLPAYSVIAFGLIINGISHIVSYPALYKATELTRHLVVRNASRLPQNSKVIWFGDPGQEIFGFSAAIHASLFFNRPDLEIKPSTSLPNLRSLKRNDMIVLYGSKSRLDFQNNPGLSYKPVIQGNYISSIKSYGDYIIMFKAFLSGKDWIHLIAPTYYEGTIHTYLVTDNEWNIPETLLPG